MYCDPDLRKNKKVPRKYENAHLRICAENDRETKRDTKSTKNGGKNTEKKLVCVAGGISLATA